MRNFEQLGMWDELRSHGVQAFVRATWFDYASSGVGIVSIRPSRNA
jgi:hypothetical protein